MRVLECLCSAARKGWPGMRLWIGRNGRVLAVAGILGALALLLRESVVEGTPPSQYQEQIDARFAEGKGLSMNLDIALGMALAAQFNLAATVLLLAGCWFWARPLARPRQERRASGGTRFWWLLAFLTVAGGASRVPLAAGSLWWDELWSVRRVMVGEFHEDGEGGLDFHPVEWRRTFWYYPRPTNHALSSVTGRLAHEAWAAWTRAPEHEFNDFVIRLPSWLATTAGFWLLGWLFWRWGYPGAGLLAVVLLILHPWAWRYGIEARGYSFVLFCALAGCHWLTTIWQGGGRSWLPWIGLGLNQWMLVWAFPQAVWLAGAFAIGAVGAVLAAWGDWRDRGVAWGRLAAVHIVSMMGFVQVMAPNLVQLSRWVEHDDSVEFHPITPGRLCNTICLCWTGLPWAWPEDSKATGLVTLGERWSEFPGPTLVFLVFSAGCMCLGARELWRRRKGFAWVGGVPVLGTLVALLSYFVLFSFYYDRFVIWGLLVPVLFAPVGAVVAGRWLGFGRWGRAPRWLPWAPAVLLVAGHAWLAGPLIQASLVRDIQPLRPIASLLWEWRGAPWGEPGRTGLMAVTLGAGGEQTSLYYPELQLATSKKALEVLCGEADASGRPLVVFIGMRDFNRRLLGGNLDFLERSPRFELVEELEGMEPEYCFQLYRYRGAPP